MKTILACFLCLACLTAHGQNKRAIDSLMRVYNTAKHDTSKVLMLCEIAFQYYRSKPDTTISLASQALSKSELIGFENGKGWALNRMAIGYLTKGQNPEAVAHLEKSLPAFQKGGAWKGFASSYNNLGIIYRNQGNYPKALECYQQSLGVSERQNDKWRMSVALGNIGTIYNHQGDYAKALEYYQRSLEVSEKIGGKQEIASSLNDIGLLYYNQSNYAQALAHYQRSLEIKEKIGDKQGIATSLNNISAVYDKQGNYEQALAYQQRSLKVAEEIGDKKAIASALVSLANTRYNLKEYDKSIEYAQKALQIAQGIRANKEIKDVSGVLFKDYKQKGDYLKALEHHELYKQMADSLFNTDKSKTIANLEARAEIERKAREIEIVKKDVELHRIEAERGKIAKLALEKQAEADKLFAMANHEKDKRKSDSLRSLAQQKQLEVDKHLAEEQKLKAESKSRQLEILKQKEAGEFQLYILYLVAGGFVSVIIFSLYVLRSRQKEIRAKEVIQHAHDEVRQVNEEIQQINEELQTTLAQVQQYSDVIENKNKHITASIQYAQRIQQAILPLPEEITKHLPENFILFKPRDIVSGDFYYFHEQAGKMLLATIDCTGHGVPGAFMTMIGYEILNEIIVNNRVLSPELILMELHKSIRKALRQAETDNRDGMDLSFIVLDRQAGKMEFAGAKNPILYIQNNELFEIKGDKMPIGGEQQEAERIFTKHEISLNTPTTVYLFSDGYQDQFGGEKKQKFRIASMRALFLENHHKALDEQKAEYNQIIEAWMNMGAEKQIDDILIVGIRV